MPRTVGYHLWNVGTFPLEERKQIVSEVSNEISHLKNSVALHGPGKEYDAIEHRIDVTKDRLRRLAAQLEQLDSPETTRYLRDWESSMLRYAELATCRGPRTQWYRQWVRCLSDARISRARGQQPGWNRCDTEFGEVCKCSRREATRMI